MTPKQAIRILMLSPCYWLLNLSARKQLVREYCAAFAAWQPCAVPLKNRSNPESVAPRSNLAPELYRFFLPLHSGSWPNRACHQSSGSYGSSPSDCPSSRFKGNR